MINVQLDPSKVKAGDTVTVRIEEEYAHTEHPAYTITDTVAYTPSYSGTVMVGPFVLDQENITLLAHTPAPEPEPEWKPGTVADIEVGGGMQYRAIRTDDNLWSTESHWSYEDIEVTDVRVLVVIDPASVDVPNLAALYEEKFVETNSSRTALRAVLSELGLAR